MINGLPILFLFIMLPITIVLLVLWAITYWKSKRHIPGIILLVFWKYFFILIALVYFLEWSLKPVILTTKDIYGTFVIDKDKFAGKQADWQYENIRFKITEKEEMIFQTRIYKDNWKTEKVKVSFSTGYYYLNLKEYCNRRLIIHSDSTNHHIIQNNPTLYRKNFSRFYYVFESEKYGNVFFKKGKWNQH